MTIKLSQAQIAENVLKQHNGKEFREAKFQWNSPDGSLNVLVLSGEPNIPGLDKLPLLEKLDLELTATGYLAGYNQRLRLVSIKNGKASA